MKLTQQKNTTPDFNLTGEWDIYIKVPKKAERDIQKLADAFSSNPCNETFSPLVKRIMWGLRKHVFDIVQDDYSTDEIISKTLENLYFGINTYNKKKGKFSTWMYRIAYFNALKYVERGKIESYSLGVDFESIYDKTIGEENDADSSMTTIMYSGQDIVDIIRHDNGTYEVYDFERLKNEIRDASISCMEYLPDNLRIVMKERYINNKKMKDIADDNGFPLTSVQNWLVKGRIALDNELKERYGYIYELYKETEPAA